MSCSAPPHRPASLAARRSPAGRSTGSKLPSAACPIGEPDLDGPRTLWVDKETLFVLKSEARSLADGRITLSTEVTSIAYNAPIDPALLRAATRLQFVNPTASQPGVTRRFRWFS